MAAWRRLVGRFEAGLDGGFDGRGREFLAICVLTFIQGYAWYLVLSLFPLYARQLGADEMLVGLLSTLPPLLSIISSVPGGAIAASIGKASVFRLSFITGLAAAAAYALSPNHWLLPVPQALFGLASALFWPSQGAYVTEVIPERSRARMLGIVMSITTAGAVAGPVSAGVLAGYLGYWAVFAAYGLLSLLCLAVCRTLPSRRLKVNIENLRGAVSGSVASGRYVLASPTIRLTTWVIMATYAFWGLADTFFPLYLEDMRFPVAAIGGIITVRTTFMTLARIFSGGFVGKARTVPMLYVLLLSSALAMALVPVVAAGAPVLLLACVAVMGSASGVVPVFTTMLIAMATDGGDRPVAMGIDSAASSMGRMASSFALGIVARTAGLTACLWSGSVAVAAATLGVAFWWTHLVRGDASGLAGRRIP
ncbi:MAG: MFS transporter [Ignavibacteriales bacterium]